MAPLTKSGEARAIEKDSGAERPSGELMVRRVRGGSSPMKVVIEGHIMRAGPDKRIENILGCDDFDIRDAACSLARCWMANGYEEKARALMKTYGLNDSDVRSSSLPPAPPGR